MDKKILVVDDSTIYIEIVTAGLNEIGYKIVDSALTGKEGLKKAKDTNPDLIICDVLLPDSSGFEICQQIKSFAEITAKVILITGQVDGVDARRARLSGADSFLVKTTGNSLLKKVDEFLNN